MAIHEKSSELLTKFCKYYLTTGLSSFPSTDVTTEKNIDTYLNELETNDYLIHYDDVVDTIELLVKSIEFAERLR